jgi:tRNA 2-thiocytidine biosynthesis protein TtcA
MLKQWDETSPGRVQNIFNALGRVTPSHLLDRGLFDFAGLSTADADNLDELDTAFDAENYQTLFTDITVTVQ